MGGREERGGTVEAAEVLLQGAHFLTQEPGPAGEVEALALAGGRILAAGGLSEVEALVTPRTRRVDLGGLVVVPGFVDAHTHIWKIGQLLTTMLDLREVAGLEELKARLREAAAAAPEGTWIQGRGYNEARMEEGRGPTRVDLDEAVGARPAYLIRTCGHIGVASSAALRAAGVGRNSDAPPGGAICREESGEPTGELHETAMGLVTRVIPAPDAAAYEGMIRAAAGHHLAQGITGATDAGVGPELLAVYRALDAAGELPWRVHAMAVLTSLDSDRALALPERHISPWLRVDTVKLFADGGLSGATAALGVPYRGAPGRGLLRLDAEQMFELGRGAHARGLRLAVHAIGDRAIEATLDALERIQGEDGAATGAPGRSPLDHRGHRIEHCGLPSREQLARAARLGLAVAPQAIFLAELAGNFRRYLPASLLPRTYPLRSMLDAGLPVALSSDAPVVRSDDPLRGIQAAVLRAAPGEEPLVPEEALGVDEALSAYTLGGAVASGEGSVRGRLAAGCWADLAVLSDDPRRVPPEELHRIHVEQTWVAGEVAHER